MAESKETKISKEEEAKKQKSLANPAAATIAASSAPEHSGESQVLPATPNMAEKKEEVAAKQHVTYYLRDALARRMLAEIWNYFNKNLLHFNIAFLNAETFKAFVLGSDQSILKFKFEFQSPDEIVQFLDHSEMYRRFFSSIIKNYLIPMRRDLDPIRITLDSKMLGDVKPDPRAPLNKIELNALGAITLNDAQQPRISFDNTLAEIRALREKTAADSIHLNKLIADLKAKAEANDKARKKLQTDSENLQKREKELEKVKREYLDMRSALEVKSAALEATAKQRELEALEQKNRAAAIAEAHQKLLKELQEQKKALEEEKNNYAEAKKQLEAERVTLEYKASKHDAAIKELQQQIDQTKKVRAAARIVNQKIPGLIESAREKIAMAMEKKSAQNLQKFEAETKRLQSDLKNVQAELERARSNAAELQKQIKDLETQLLLSRAAQLTLHGERENDAKKIASLGDELKLKLFILAERDAALLTATRQSDALTQELTKTQ